MDKMLGNNKKANIGIYVGIGTIGYFRDLKTIKKPLKIVKENSEKINGI